MMMNKIGHDLKAGNNNALGFTLIEMAFVVMISGLMAIIYTQAYFRYVEDERTKITNERMDTIQSAIKEYHSLRGVYPYPSNLTWAQNQPQYGRENNPPAIVASSLRDADGVGGVDPIYIGAVPFKTILNPDGNDSTDDGIRDVPLTAADTIDGWGNKIRYVVTANLTELVTYNQNHGVIRLVDEFDVSITDPADTLHVVLISHGPNGVGAFSVEGNATNLCALTVAAGPPPPPPPPPTTPTNETENCDNDGVFFKGIKNLTENSYNDDIVRAFSLTADRLWVNTGSNMAANTNSGNVGVRTDTPQQKLDVNGAITAQQFIGEQFCDSTNDATTCMPLETIAGIDPNMSCAPGGTGIGAGANMVVTAIENNQVICGPLFTTMPSGSCGAGEMMVGLRRTSVGSAIICEPMP